VRSSRPPRLNEVELWATVKAEAEAAGFDVVEEPDAESAPEAAEA
jgi:hypothetical protein